MRRGEIWIVDLGIAQKPRPAVILSVEYREDERALVSYVPRTTSVRGTRFEVEHRDGRFKPGVFDAQGIGTVTNVRLTRRLALLDETTLSHVEDAVRAWLGL